MRVVRALAAGSLGLAGTLGLVLAGGPALAAPVFGSVTVDPQSGPGNTTITAIYRQGEFPTVCRGLPDITFKWDGHGVATGKLGPNCVARAAFKPPKDDRGDGPHEVSAWEDKNQVAVTIFVVNGTDPSGSPSPSTSPSPSPSRSKDVKPSASPSIDSTAADPPLPTYDAPSIDGTVAAAGAPTDASTVPASSGGGGSSLGVALLFGGVLVLGGVLILGYIVIRGRRDEPEAEGGLLDLPTQRLPSTYPGAFVPVAEPEDPAEAEQPPAVPD